MGSDIGEEGEQRGGRGGEGGRAAKRGGLREGDEDGLEEGREVMGEGIKEDGGPEACGKKGNEVSEVTTGRDG